MDPRLLLALAFALGAMLLTLGWLRVGRRRQMSSRLRALGVADVTISTRTPRTGFQPRLLAGRLGARLAPHWASELRTLARRIESAGLAGGVTPTELLGWKALSIVLGLGMGLVAVAQYGLSGAVLLLMTLAVGWFGVDLALARTRERRRRSILRDLPTVMDLLVLSLEAGMGLDRALRTVVQEYRTPLSEEIQHVLTDIELGIGRAEAFTRMSSRIGLDDLQSLSRAIVQTEDLGVSMVAVMQTQSHEVRLSRRRAAEAEALRAPVKMLIPLVVFILPTLFMLLLGPVGLRAGAAITGAQP